MPDRVGEERVVAGTPEAKRAALLHVDPAGREVVGAVHLVVDDRLRPHGGSDHRVAALPQRIEEGIETDLLDDRGHRVPTLPLPRVYVQALIAGGRLLSTARLGSHRTATERHRLLEHRGLADLGRDGLGMRRPTDARIAGVQAGGRK